MNSNNGYILVLWDHSDEAVTSFQHALLLAEKSKFEILIARILKKRKLFESRETFEKEVVEERECLNRKALELEAKFGLLPKTTIALGNFKSAVKKLLDEHQCSLIVCPEHISIHKGLTVNILNEFSSYGEIDIPIIIANNPPRQEHETLEVIVPMEYHPEFKDTIDWVILFSRKYHCNFDFVKPILTDAQPKKELINNIYFTKQVLDDNNIVYGIKTASKMKSFIDDIYDFASKIEANYIMSTTLNYHDYRKNPMFAEMPFICINPRKRKYRGFN